MKESLKTPPIDAKHVTRFYAEFAKPAANQIVKIGGSPDIQFQADYTYRLRVEAKGSPALGPSIVIFTSISPILPGAPRSHV